MAEIDIKTFDKLKEAMDKAGVPKPWGIFIEYDNVFRLYPAEGSKKIVKEYINDNKNRQDK